MSLRRKFILYLILIHAVFAALAVGFLWEHRVWLLAVEAFFVFTLVCGIRLVRNLFVPLDLIRTGTELMGESDFASRFQKVGQPEMDQLVSVYNRMVDHLREERVRMQEQHYFLDKVLQESPSGIVTFDFEGQVVLANPSARRMLQYPLEDLRGKRLSEVHTPLADALSDLKEGEPKVLPFQGGRRLRCLKSHFLDRGFARSFILMEELTEELRQSERTAYGNLIRTLSHEVNTSIGAVNSLLHSCLNYKDQLRSEDRKDFETAVQVSISRTEHLNGFMKRFADVVRLPQPERRPCDIQKLLEEIAFLMGPESQKRKITWTWDISERLDPVPADKNQMEQVFVNILKNAMEAVETQGRITIRIGKTEGRGFVVVEDTGEGISPETRSRLFTPFFSTKENGQGIGLTLVQEILTRHRFEFSLEGKPGQPTRFSITFS